MSFCGIGQERSILKVNPITEQVTVYKGTSGYGNTYILQVCIDFRLPSESLEFLTGDRVR